MPLEVQDAAQGPAPSGSAGEMPARRRPAPETARAYAMDWQAFVAWCQAAERTALPAAPATVAAFLAAAAETLSAGALGRRAAAISDRHRQAGFPPPTADPAVRAILRAARRAATPKRPPPRRPSQLVRMASACPGDLAGLRDRALLMLAADGLGRTAPVGLDVEHLRFTAAAVELTIRAAAGAGDDKVRRISVPRGATLATCPVQALAD